MAEEGIKGWHIMLILLGIGGALGALMLYLTTRQGQGGGGGGTSGGGGGTSGGGGGGGCIIPETVTDIGIEFTIDNDTNKIYSLLYPSYVDMILNDITTVDARKYENGVYSSVKTVNIPSVVNYLPDAIKNNGVFRVDKFLTRDEVCAGNIQKIIEAFLDKSGNNLFGSQIFAYDFKVKEVNTKWYVPLGYKIAYAKGRIDTYINVEQGFDSNQYYNDGVIEFYDKEGNFIGSIPVTINSLQALYTFNIDPTNPNTLKLGSRYPKVKFRYHDTKVYDLPISESSSSSNAYRWYTTSFTLYRSEWIPKVTSATLHLGYNLQMIPDPGTYYTTLRYRVYDYYMNVLLYENLTDLAMDGLNWRQDVIFSTLGYKKFTVVYEYLDDWNRVLWNMTNQGLYDGDSYIIDIPNTKLIKRSGIT
jgi:hypothetical protein